MKFTAAQIAGILNGTVDGDESVTVSKLAKIEEGNKGSLTFLANPKYTHYIYKTKSCITIVNDDFVATDKLATTLIRVENAYKAFSQLLEYYNKVKMNKTGIENPVFISESAKYGENLYLGAFSYIGENVKIGDNVKIYPNVYIGDNVTVGNNTILFTGAKLYSETIVGESCVINSGVVIGADGFGFTPNRQCCIRR
jgi:UDP-3-O-[3-hydroxymyristoyl] glucosamine N-acyltransferase